MARKTINQRMKAKGQTQSRARARGAANRARNPNARVKPTSKQRRTTHKVSVSDPHSAQRNAVVLAQSGSPEAISHNVSLQKIEAARAASAAAKQGVVSGSAQNTLMGRVGDRPVQEPIAIEEPGSDSVSVQNILEGTGLTDFGRSVAMGAQGFGGVQGGNPLQEYVNEIGATVGAVGTAIAGPFIATWGALAAIITEATATGSAIAKNKVGTLTNTAATGGASVIAVNSVTQKKTGSMMTAVGMSPAAAGLAVGAIGTYPFAGFIREEALQTLGFGLNTAIKNNDWEGAQEAIALQKEILNPDTWKELTNQVPYANVLKALDLFYKAAAVKLSIDERLMSDLRYKQEFGETDEEMYARIRRENEDSRMAQREADEKYYAEIEERRRAAKAEEREADERYWSKILSERKAADEAERKQELEYLEAYYRRMEELRDNEGRSNLSFGLF